MDSARQASQLLDAIPVVSGDADMRAMYSAADAIRALPDPRLALSAVFHWLERHAEADVGSPGPLGHFLEEFDEYVPLLRESLGRAPTHYTVYLANRIANGATDRDELCEWTDLFGEIANRASVDELCRETAAEYAAHQRARLEA